MPHSRAIRAWKAGAAAIVCVLMGLLIKAASGDPARGKALFERRCSGCHTLEKDKEGPRLGGVYGRTSATVASFKYSDALTNAHLLWDDKSLDRWLADPEQVAPGNDMAFQVANPGERAEIIAYLRQASGK